MCLPHKVSRTVNHECGYQLCGDLVSRTQSAILPSYGGRIALSERGGLSTVVDR